MIDFLDIAATMLIYTGILLIGLVVGGLVLLALPESSEEGKEENQKTIKVTKSKVFSTADPDSLNQMLNDWLESEKPTHLWSVTQSSSGYEIVLTIIYTK